MTSETTKIFGTNKRGEIVEKISIRAGNISVSFLTLGAILQDVRLDGIDHSLTLGSDDISAYDGPMIYFGAVVGPVANRIKDATTRIDGIEHHFPANEGNTSLHGGNIGMHGRVWDIVGQTAISVTFRLDLKDGEDGFPGARRFEAHYEITGRGQLSMTLTATTDRVSPVNLANHSYWNLDGSDGTAGHTLWVAADAYLPVDDEQIPTGEVRDVTGTAFDFRDTRNIGTDVSDRIDHNLCISDARVDMRKVAVLTGKQGHSLTLETTEPGLQVYDAENVRSAPVHGFEGFEYKAFCGIAMESQGWPDAPNRPAFPQINLQPGETYRQATRWTFAKG